MALKEFTKIIVPPDKEHAQDLELLQSNIIQVLKQFTDQEFLDGHLLEDVDVEIATTLVPHKLGRKVRGFIVVDKTVTTHVVRDATSTTHDETLFLALTCGTECTVSLIVF